MLRWFLADLRTGKRILDLQVLSGTWQVVLNQPDTLRAVVDLQDPRNIALNLRNTSAVSKTILAVADGDRILAAGIVWTRRSLGDGRTLELGARGVWSYYDHRYVLPLAAASLPVDMFTIPDPLDNTKTIPNPAITTAYVNLSIGTIAKRVVQQAHAWTGGALPIVFMADEAGIHGRTYLGPEMKNVGTVLKQLTSVEDGADIEFRPRFTADRLGVEFLLLTGTNAQPFIASTTEAIWDMAVPQPAASGLQVFEDGSRLAGLGWATGGRSAGVALVSRASDPSLVANGYPLFESLDSSHSTVQEQDTLDTWAAAIVARGLTPLEQITFAAVPSRAPFLTNYNVGDYARVVLPPYSDPDLPPIELARNLATNPSMEATSGTVEVRRNLALKPYPASAGGWLSNNGTNYPVTLDAVNVRRDGTQSTKAIRAAVAPSSILLSCYAVGATAWTNAGRTPVTAGQSYTSSYYGMSDQPGFRLQQTVAFFDAAGVQVGAILSGTIQAGGVAGQWMRNSDTFVAPALAVSMGVSGAVVMTSGGSSVGGEQSWIQDAQIELGTVATPYMDGDMAASGDFSYAWTAAAFASASVEQALAVTNAATPNSQGMIYQSAEDGDKVLKYTVISPSAWGLNFTFTPTLNALYTFYYEIVPSWTGALRIRNGHTSTTEVPIGGLVAGQPMIIRQVLDTPAVNANIGLVGRGADGFSPGSTLIVRRMMIVAGAYDGPFFDGDTRSNVDFLYQWSGAKDASASTRSSAVVPGRKRGHPYFLEGGDFPLRIVGLSGDEKNEQVAVTAMPRGEEWDG